MPQAPDHLWGQGEKDGYCTVILKVRVCQGSHGEIWSTHTYASQQDQDLCSKWSGGGIRQVAHALHTEALRREAFVSALVRLSANPNFVSDYAAATEEKKREIELELSGKVLTQFTDTARRSSLHCTREIMAMLLKQHEDQVSGSMKKEDAE